MSTATYTHGFVTYSGDGAASRGVTGLGFAPDAVVVKVSNSGGGGQGGCFKTTAIAGTDSAPIPGGALISDGILSLDADGFTIGANARVNGVGNTYVALGIKIGTGHYFRTGTYAGDGVNARAITIDGTGWKPDFGLILSSGATLLNGVLRTRQHVGDESVMLANDVTAANLIESFDANGFTVGSDDDVNKSGETFYYFMWRRFTAIDLDAVAMTGQYTGDGGATQDITGIGLQPAWLLHATAVTTIGSFWRHISHNANESSAWLTPTISSGGAIRSFAADGFQIGSTINGLSDVHDYLALTASAALSVSLAEVTFDPGDPVAGDSIGLSWAEFQDAAGTTHAWSHLSLADPSTYYSGFKEGRLTTWQTIKRALSDVQGQFEGVTFGWTLADTDRVIRGLLAAASTRFFRGRPVAIRAINDSDRRALLAARTMARGIVSTYQPHEPFLFEFSCVDRFTHDYGSSSDSRQTPRRRIRATEFADALTEVLDLPEPIIYGRASDFPGGTGTAQVTGVTAVAQAMSGAAPTNVTATAVSGGTSKESITRHYIIAAVVGGKETLLSAMVSATTTATLRTIRLTWDAVPGASRINVYASDRSVFGQFAYKILAGGATTVDDTFVAPNQNRNHLDLAGFLLGLRLNMRYRVYALLSDGTFSNPGEVTLDADANGLDISRHPTSFAPHSWIGDRNVLISWSAFTGAVGYRIVQWTSKYSDWGPTWDAFFDVDATTLSYTDTVVFQNVTTPIDLPGDLVAADGVMPCTHVGTEEISGTTWQRLLVCGHAVKEIQAVFRSTADAAGGSVSESDRQGALALKEVPAADFGVTWLAPGKSGWPHPNDYVDIGTRRYTLIYTTEDPVPSQVAVNVLGIEDVGDGTGTLLTAIAEITQHWLENWVYGDYQQGAWLGTPTFDDDTTLAQIDTASFTQAQTDAETRLAGGYVGAVVIGAGGRFETIRDVLAALCRCGDFDFGFNRRTQAMISMFVESALTTATAFDDTRDIIDQSFDVTDVVTELYNVVPYAYAFDYLTAAFEKTDEVRDQASIDNYDEESVMPRVELPYIRLAVIAMDIVRRRLLRHKDPPRVVRFSTSLQGLSVDLGDLITVTHPEGIGASGWTNQAVRVTRHEVDPLDYRVMIEGLDVQRLFRESFILGDEATLPADWDDADENERAYGYLADEATGTFTDGEPIKRLR